MVLLQMEFLPASQRIDGKRGDEYAEDCFDEMAVDALES